MIFDIYIISYKMETHQIGIIGNWKISICHVNRDFNNSALWSCPGACLQEHRRPLNKTTLVTTYSNKFLRLWLSSLLLISYLRQMEQILRSNYSLLFH